MANGHGGHRTPEHPAPVSGPGALSRRTDGGPSQPLRAPTGLGYGDHQALIAQQRADPLPAQQQPAAAQQVQSTATVPPHPTQFAGVGFNAPTQRPGEPVTAGLDIGAGPGAAGMPTPLGGAPATGAMTRMLRQVAPTEASGVLAQLLQTAELRGV